MERRLLLIRHAKSSWKDPTLSDPERPLNKRGRRDGPRVVAALRGRLPTPDLVLCSPSRRTRDTLAMLTPLLGADADFVEALYHAGPDEMIGLLRRVPDATGVVALVGHEPGLGELVRALDPEHAPFEKFPTLGIAELALAVPWSDLDRRRARLRHLYRPKDLPGHPQAPD